VTTESFLVEDAYVGLVLVGPGCGDLPGAARPLVRVLLSSRRVATELGH